MDGERVKKEKRDKKDNGYRQWSEWFDDIIRLEGDWLYRGQASDESLRTSLERECEKSGFRLDEDADKIEEQMIRQFQRVYDGDDRNKVKDDVLYCLSLMRHFGAPVRLLDFTYSKYIAIYFGLESAYEHEKGKCTIWCINQKKLKEKAEKIPEVKNLLEDRRDDNKRDDDTFRPLYMENKYEFASWENPLQLHRRLHLQHGTFLCPGNIKVTLMENLLTKDGINEDDLIKKFKYSFTPIELQEAFEKFMRMNITRESLFPGLDGLGKSMKYQLWFYKKLHYWVEGEK